MSLTNSNPYFSCIFSRTNDNGFGLEDHKPWDIKEDLSHFRNIVTEEKDSVLIMGRKTRKQLEGKFQNCTYIIISSSLLLENQNSSKVEDNLEYIVTNLSEALSLAAIHNGNIFVIGGKQLLDDAFKSQYLERIYETLIIPKQPLKSDIKFDTTIPVEFTIAQRKVTETQNALLTFSVYCKHAQTSEQNYHRLVKDVLEKGKTTNGVRSSFGHQVSVNLRNEFPMLTSKNDSFSFMTKSLLWITRGHTHIKNIKDKNLEYLIANQDTNTHGDKNKIKLSQGEIGHSYGHQWRNFGGLHRLEKQSWIKYMLVMFLFIFAYVANAHDALIYGFIFMFLLWPNKQKGIDQLKMVIEKIKSNPSSDQLVVNSWNPQDLNKTLHSLSHLGFHFMVNEMKELSIKINQIKADVLQEVPHVISMYSLLTHIVADMCGLKPGDLVYSVGSAYINSFHLNTAEKLVSRPIRNGPQLQIIKDYRKKYDKVEDYTFNDFKLHGYQPHSMMNIGTIL
jgi:thymidylate synthase/dihydrofolate reductase